MNGLVIVLISYRSCIGAGYLLYGRWLARKWGQSIENAQTPAFTQCRDRSETYVPSSKADCICASVLSSIAGGRP